MLDDGQPAIPGLPALTPRDNDTPMVTAARVSLSALAESGRIEARHAVLVQSVITLAGAMDAGLRNGRASAVAMAAKNLLDTMQALDPPPEDGDADAAARKALADFFATIEDHANANPPA
jgi:arginine decarboxylase-like protein